MIRKRRSATIWVEWADEENAEKLADMLVRKGVRGVEIDSDVDIEDYPFPGIKHEHTVFRVSVGEEYPVWRILADVASRPDVYSVGEV